MFDVSLTIQIRNCLNYERYLVTLFRIKDFSYNYNCANTRKACIFDEELQCYSEGIRVTVLI